MEFWKMNGAGNDFIVINNLVEKLPHDALPHIAKTLCERHLSIGADGFMAVDAPEAGVAADYRMLFYNADGSVGEMCGNGARCICRYGYEIGLAGQTQTVQTTAGIVVGHRMTQRQYQVQLNNPTTVKLDQVVEVDGAEYPCAYIELGTPGLPHAVVPIKNLKEADRAWLFDLGRKLRFHKAFPKGANVNFYDPVADDEVLVRTYERGVEDFTYACGTGAGSTTVALNLSGKLHAPDLKIDMVGGQLKIHLDYDASGVHALLLTGPTNIVAKGVVTDEEL
ncbi:MAG: diaminopimelate epimerase [Oscillospiraceae bacterium]|nr:diaminopimelate epimerase [Oscillospiraceae bacterium]